LLTVPIPEQLINEGVAVRRDIHRAGGTRENRDDRAPNGIAAMVLADQAVTTRPLPGDEPHFWPPWYTLPVFEFLLIASGIDIAILTLLVQPIEVTLRITDVGFAGINAIPVAIGIAAGYYPAGLLADTFPRRNIISVGVTMWVLGALIATRADSAALFWSARLLAGIGGGMVGPPALSILSDAFSRERRAFAISAYMAGASLGIGIGLTVCGALVEATQRNGAKHIGNMLLLPWQRCFVAVVGFGLVSLALILTVSERTRRERTTRMNAGLRVSARAFRKYIWNHRLLWGLMCFGYVVGTTSLDAVLAWAPAFGTRHFGITGTSPIALLGTFRAGGSLVGSIAGGILAQQSVTMRALVSSPQAAESNG
jgi:MFS family permease